MLPEQLEDADLGRFAKALYFLLVPAGEGTEELRVADTVARRVTLSTDEQAMLDGAMAPVVTWGTPPRLLIRLWPLLADLVNQLYQDLSNRNQRGPLSAMSCAGSCSYAKFAP